MSTSIRAMARPLLLGLMTLLIAACGPTEREKTEKAQDKAKTLVTEQNELSKYVNDTGSPSSLWSHEKLNEYEAKLNRLSVVEAELRRMDGNNGVVIYNANNSELIKTRLDQVKRAREYKIQKETEKATKASTEASYNARVDKAMEKKDKVEQAWIDAGRKSSNMSDESLNKLFYLIDDAILEHGLLITFIRANEKYLDYSQSKIWEAQKSINELKEFRQDVEAEAQVRQGS